ncbi:MAG: helix-turn-helix transcriptional regulator [Pseudomonadales bacterium]|nr:helix-turn-helix transcriptional regulator [Pseudomonadales bacterium]
MVSNKAHHQELNLIAVSGRDLVADQLAALELMCAIVERSLLKLPSSESRLTAREREILCWAAEGKTNWDIGMILGISERTVKFHFSNIFLKLSVQNRPQAVVMGIKLGHI